MKASCMACGGAMEEEHKCPIPLTEVERDMMVVMVEATFCDHYCCGMTEYVCRAKALLHSLNSMGYKLLREGK